MNKLSKAVVSTNSKSGNKENQSKSIKMEIYPEWILDKFSDTRSADGKGNIDLYTHSINDSRWMTLAMSTLGIPYKEEEFIDENDEFFFCYSFKLDGIEESCPSLYARMVELNNSKKKHFGYQ